MANLKLIDNLIVSPDTSTLSMASCINWLDYRMRKLLDRSNDWLLDISDGKISGEWRHANFNSYIQIKESR